MRGRMVLALTVALVEQAQRPWVVDGQVVGTIGPKVRIGVPVLDAGLAVVTPPLPLIPEVVIPPEDLRIGGMGARRPA